MRADLAAGTIVVVAGFQGVDADGNITTLGRGGSDTSGVALAAALDGRRVPDLHRRRRRLHDRSAHRARGAPPRHGHVRGNARDGEPGLEGAADPLGRVRRQVQGQAARAVVVRGSGIDVAGHAHHVRGRRDHGTGDHFRHRVQSRRSQDLGDGRRGPARHRLQHRRADRRRQHRRRHDRAEHRRVGAHRLLVHREPQRVSEGARRARSASAARRSRRARSSATTGSARCRSSASACARTSASRAGCSRRWPTRGSTSR